MDAGGGERGSRGGEGRGGQDTRSIPRPDFQTAFTLTKVARTPLDRSTGDVCRDDDTTFVTKYLVCQFFVA